MEPLPSLREPVQTALALLAMNTPCPVGCDGECDCWYTAAKLAAAVKIWALSSLKLSGFCNSGDGALGIQKKERLHRGSHAQLHANLSKCFPSIPPRLTITFYMSNSPRGCAKQYTIRIPQETSTLCLRIPATDLDANSPARSRTFRVSPVRGRSPTWLNSTQRRDSDGTARP